MLRSSAIIQLLFANHISFYASLLGMNYNNVVGFGLFSVFVLQFVSGVLLSCYYSDSGSLAFDCVVYIMSDCNLG